MSHYNNLNKYEQDLFIAKLMLVIQKDQTSFMKAEAIVRHGEEIGMFDKVKFGNGIYQENDLVTVID